MVVASAREGKISGSLPLEHLKMIMSTVIDRIGSASTPADVLTARHDLNRCRINEAFSLGALTYQEQWELRTWLKTVQQLIKHRMLDKAAEILGDMDYILDAASPIEEVEDGLICVLPARAENDMMSFRELVSA